MSEQEQRPRIGPARGGKFKLLPRKLTYIPPTKVRPKFCLDTVNFEEVLSDLSDEEAAGESGGEEARNIIEAVHLALENKLEDARDVAEAVQLHNPNDSTALYINGTECETRQDWSEAARFFLVGMGQNSTDGVMEHGFQTNIDMLRTQRHKWHERERASKWDDVLAFKPRPPRVRPPSPDDKAPWWRLGPWYEELVGEGGFLTDLLESQGNPEEQALELRRVIYEQLDYLDKVYAYYRDDINDNWNPDLPMPGVQKHDGHESHTGETQLKLSGLWRLLKECKIVFGDVKTKMPVAVFDRILVQGKRRMRVMSEMVRGYEITEVDPHEEDTEINFYDFFETLVRTAHLKLQGTVSERLESLIKEYIRPFAMRKQTDKSFIDFRSTAVTEYFRDPPVRYRLRRIFDFFIASYKSNKVKSNTLGVRDVTMSFNHVYSVLEKCDIFDPVFNIKKAVEMFCKVTLDSDLLPQEHPNNQNSEMVFHEFLEFVMRCSRVKSNNTREATIDALTKYAPSHCLCRTRFDHCERFDQCADKVRPLPLSMSHSF